MCLFPAVVVCQAQPGLLVITPITGKLDVSSDFLAVCLQVANKKKTSLLQDRCFGCCFSTLSLTPFLRGQLGMHVRASLLMQK